MKKEVEKYNKARLLRLQGKSIRYIAKQLIISTSTASIWCKDIQLTIEQKNELNNRGNNADLLRSYAQKRHVEKIERDQKIFRLAKEGIIKLSPNEFLIAGLALYWAEGFKTLKEGRAGFCNSDPRMIKFIMNWFRKSLKIEEKDFVLRAEFNIDHQYRSDEIEKYWSVIADIPRSQFNKPYLQKAKLLRDYSKKGIYFGLVRIKIRKSSQLLTKLLGNIEGLSLSS